MRDSRDERSFDSRFDVAFQPGFDETSGALPEFESLGFDDDAPLASAAPSSRRLVDRFVVILWILGVALTAAGIGASVVSSSLYSGSQINFTPDFFMISVLSLSSQWLVPVGLATLVGTVFLLAVRWEHRP